MCRAAFPFPTVSVFMGCVSTDMPNERDISKTIERDISKNSCYSADWLSVKEMM